MAQVERGASRIYHTGQGPPFLPKYLTAALLATSAGSLALLSLVVLVGGSPIRDSVRWGETIHDVWARVRCPKRHRAAVISIALLFEERAAAPSARAVVAGLRRRHLGPAVVLLHGRPRVYVEATGSFGARMARSPARSASCC
ncbi:MAG: hypothetical protein M3336_16690, partial [Chloroflexota bacterium]|nr:hypothetical protein [Chloroflexota bacterium]